MSEPMNQPWLTRVAGNPAVIEGYSAIARAVAERLGRSYSAVTAKRHAQGPKGLRPRLPVFVWPNGRAYAPVEMLELWVAVWQKARLPTGARLPRGAKS